MPAELATRRCIPCSGSTPPLPPDEVQSLLGEIKGWDVRSGKLCRQLEFKDFVTAMAFVNRVAEVAEREGHHPDFCVYYRIVDFTIWTHAIGGLSENDFILAAKIDALNPE